MLSHLRANLLLLLSTVIICCVLYPLSLWIVGQVLFPGKAEGSLVDKDGRLTLSAKEAVGSRLIAQPFTGEEFFQPRPSAASYNAAASGASNWGANNYLLRDRVARQLGPIVRYGKSAEKFGKKPGKGVQSDIEAWFKKDSYQNEPGIVNQWLGLHSGLAEAFVKSTGEAVKAQWKQGDKEPEPNEAFLRQGEQDLPEFFTALKESDAYKDWQKANSKDEIPNNADLAKLFFESFSKKYPGEWPTLEDYETKDKQKRKRLVRTQTGSDVQGVFFDMWRQDHPDVPLEPVPADMVMASGSGLDPHITVQNALYQLDRVAAKWAEKTKGDQEQIRQEIQSLLRAKTEAPLGGLVGPDLVNVLEVNLALRKRFGA